MENKNNQSSFSKGALPLATGSLYDSEIKGLWAKKTSTSLPPSPKRAAAFPV